jgi:hypothetical protein
VSCTEWHGEGLRASCESTASCLYLRTVYSEPHRIVRIPARLGRMETPGSRQRDARTRNDGGASVVEPRETERLRRFYDKAAGDYDRWRRFYEGRCWATAGQEAPTIHLPRSSKRSVAPARPTGRIPSFSSTRSEAALSSRHSAVMRCISGRARACSMRARVASTASPRPR